MISPSEARDHIPLLSNRILGALYVPSDIQTRATRPAEAMAREAERNGAALYGNVKVTGLGIESGRINAVHTTQGDIQTDLVVSAAGIWAPRVGGMAGVSIPLSPMQHLYAVTEPLVELAGAVEEVSHPILRHQDEAMYCRQDGESYGIGSYNHEPLLVESKDILDHKQAPIAPAEMDFTPVHFEKAAKAAGELLPALEGVGLTRKFNGLFSFTNDGFPSTWRVARRSGILVRPGRLDNARRGCRQGRRRVDCQRRADYRPARVRHTTLPPARAQPKLRPCARCPAVPRGVRHHPPTPADGPVLEICGSRPSTSVRRNSAPSSSRTRAGSGPNGTTRTRDCWTRWM